MNKQENSFKKYLVRKMGLKWDVQSHEDRYSEGIADLSYGYKKINGWIELKFVAKWPVRPSTKVRIPHFTKEQCNWLRRRNFKGGRCFIFIKIEKNHLIFDANVGPDIRNGLTKKQLLDKCIRWWGPSLDVEEFLEVISHSWMNGVKEPHSQNL